MNQNLIPRDSQAYNLLEPLSEHDKIHLVFSLMKYAVDQSKINPDFYNSLVIEEERLIHAHHNIKFIRIVCKYFRIYSLTNNEILSIQNLPTDKIYDYLIDRTKKIDCYANDEQYSFNTDRTNILILMKELGYDYKINKMYYDLQTTIFNYFALDQIIQKIHQTNYKPHKPLTLSKKPIGKSLIPNNTYISIDVKSSNFSWLFNYVGNHIFKMNVPTTFEEFVKQFSDDKILVASKHMRQIIFGKVFKKYCLSSIYETDINYITSLVVRLLIEKYPNLQLALLMNEECVIYKTNDINVGDIKDELNKLNEIIGTEMVSKLKIFEFTYRKVKNVYIKNNDKVMITPELGHQIFNGDI